MNIGRLFGLGVVFLIFLCNMISASVPRSVNYQGRLTDSNGDPQSGTFDLVFRIYDALELGNELYSSGPVSLKVTNGLFSVNLGQPPMPVLPVTIFEDTNRYLGISVEANPELTPRTKLTSVPYAFQVRTIDGATGGNVGGTVNFKLSGNTRATIAPGSSQITTYGSDGLEQIRLWGQSWGEVLMHDSDPTNDQTVRLGAEAGLFAPGGILELGDDNGVTKVLLQAGATGDAAVILPGSSVGSLEMLNEPGIASNKAGSVDLGGVATTIASRSINCPTTGYVLAMASGSLTHDHTSGVHTNSVVWLTDVNGGSSGGVPSAVFWVSGAAPTGFYAAPYALQGIFSVPAGTTTFYLRGTNQVGGAGAASTSNNILTLLFVPTSYGTVVSSAPESGLGETDVSLSGNGDGGISDGEFNDRRLAAELEELKKQMAEVKARLGSAEQVSEERKSVGE